MYVPIDMHSVGRGQRPAQGSWFSPSQVENESLVLAASAFLPVLSHFTCLCNSLFLAYTGCKTPLSLTIGNASVIA